MKKLTTEKIQITERALFQRINRLLHKQGGNLRTAHNQRIKASMGRYYIIDTEHNAISALHVDLEKLGRKLGVIEPWEEVG
jgi:glycine cleavage system regulatory protein